MARLIPLASGSRGNAALIECGSTRVLVDAGISARELARRLESVGVSPGGVDLILLSHEHNDHARGARRFSARFGTPVACGPETLEALDLSPRHLADWQPLVAAKPLRLGELTIDAFPVPHDAARPLGFVLEGAGVRVGVVTDLGHATTLVVERLKQCDALLLEANHDDMMLRDGPYPWQLKQRVGGRLGHLSNSEAAALLRRAVGTSCRAVVLAHLSESNNTPELALAAARRALRQVGRGDIHVTVASQRRPSEPVTLSNGQPGLFG